MCKCVSVCVGTICMSNPGSFYYPCTYSRVSVICVQHSTAIPVDRLSFAISFTIDDARVRSTILAIRTTHEPSYHWCRAHDGLIVLIGLIGLIACAAWRRGGVEG